VIADFIEEVCVALQPDPAVFWEKPIAAGTDEDGVSSHEELADLQPPNATAASRIAPRAKIFREEFIYSSTADVTTESLAKISQMHFPGQS